MQKKKPKKCNVSLHFFGFLLTAKNKLFDDVILSTFLRLKDKLIINLITSCGLSLFRPAMNEIGKFRSKIINFLFKHSSCWVKIPTVITINEEKSSSDDTHRNISDVVYLLPRCSSASGSAFNLANRLDRPRARSLALSSGGPSSDNNNGLCAFPNEDRFSFH